LLALRRFWSTRMEHRRLEHRRLERKVIGAQSDMTDITLSLVLTSSHECAGGGTSVD
jgi:hypothetical protein